MPLPTLKSPYMTLERWKSDKRKTPAFNVRGREGDFLGAIAFYPPWRQYVFRPAEETEFSADCQQALTDCLKEANQLMRMGRL